MYFACIKIGQCALFGMILCISAGPCSAQISNQGCSAFGNAPASMIHPFEGICPGGKRLGPWKDSDGNRRFACVFEPRLLQSGAKLPMIVYLHPSLFGVWTVRLTGLLNYQNTFSITKDPKAIGYIVLAPFGRDTGHYYPFPDRSGIGWDNWYRQFDSRGNVTIKNRSFSENVDAAAVDHFVTEETDTGRIDTGRIYVTGWSNGAAMALLYSFSRRNIAAVAVYSAPNPFRAFRDPCPQKPVLTAPTNEGEIQICNVRVSVMHIHNACDALGLCPNGNELANQLRSIGVSVQDIILGTFRQKSTECSAWCGINPAGNPNLVKNPLGWVPGLVNHMRWPSSETLTILSFFRNHPLGIPPVPPDRRQTRRGPTRLDEVR
jgi:dienelactone hydrolase